MSLRWRRTPKELIISAGCTTGRSGAEQMLKNPTTNVCMHRKLQKDILAGE
jgi:hypothetical protein